MLPFVPRSHENDTNCHMDRTLVGSLVRKGLSPTPNGVGHRSKQHSTSPHETAHSLIQHRLGESQSEPAKRTATSEGGLCSVALDADGHGMGLSKTRGHSRGARIMQAPRGRLRGRGRARRLATLGPGPSLLANQAWYGQGVLPTEGGRQSGVVGSTQQHGAWREVRCCRWGGLSRSALGVSEGVTDCRATLTDLHSAWIHTELAVLAG